MKISIIRYLLPAVVSVACILMSACASIVSKSSYPVTIASNPPGATFTVKKSGGIRGNDEDITEFDFNNMTEEQQKYHLQAKAFVGEGVVTDEIRQDFLKLGWIVIEDPNRD